MLVMVLEKLFIFGLERRGAMDGTLLRSDVTLPFGDEKLVSLGVDGRGGGSGGDLGVMGGKFAHKTLLDKAGKPRS